MPEFFVARVTSGYVITSDVRGTRHVRRDNGSGETLCGLFAGPDTGETHVWNSRRDLCPHCREVIAADDARDFPRRRQPARQRGV